MVSPENRFTFTASHLKCPFRVKAQRDLSTDSVANFQLADPELCVNKINKFVEESCDLFSL